MKTLSEIPYGKEFKIAELPHSVFRRLSTDRELGGQIQIACSRNDCDLFWLLADREVTPYIVDTTPKVRAIAEARIAIAEASGIAAGMSRVDVPEIIKSTYGSWQEYAAQIETKLDAALAKLAAAGVA